MPFSTKKAIIAKTTINKKQGPWNRYSKTNARPIIIPMASFQQLDSDLINYNLINYQEATQPLIANIRDIKNKLALAYASKLDNDEKIKKIYEAKARSDQEGARLQEVLNERRKISKDLILYQAILKELRNELISSNAGLIRARPSADGEPSSESEYSSPRSLLSIKL